MEKPESWRWLFARVKREEKAPPLHGPVWRDWATDDYVTAVVPLNLPLGAAVLLWSWLRAGWRPLFLQPHQAYLQGRAEGQRQAEARCRAAVQAMEEKCERRMARHRQQVANLGRILTREAEKGGEA